MLCLSKLSLSCLCYLSLGLLSSVCSKYVLSHNCGIQREYKYCSRKTLSNNTSCWHASIYSKKGELAFVMQCYEDLHISHYVYMVKQKLTPFEYSADRKLWKKAPGGSRRWLKWLIPVRTALKISVILQERSARPCGSGDRSITTRHCLPFHLSVVIFTLMSRFVCFFLLCRSQKSKTLTPN